MLYIRAFITSTLALFLMWVILYRLLVLCIPRQVGPTCGFYAVCYAVYKGNRIKLKSVSRKAVKWAINNGLSEIGEIFDIEIMQRITKEFFKKDSKIVDFVPEEIESLLKNYYVIFPYQENTPHYCCIKKIKGNKVYAYNGNTNKFFACTKLKENKDELFSLNQNIAFSWKKYVNGDKGKAPAFSQKGLKSPVNWLIPIYIGKDRVFYEWLREIYNEKKQYLEQKAVHLNLKGKILLIEK